MEYIWFILFGFYDISTIMGYFMPNPLYALYIEYKWFTLFGFYEHSNYYKGYLMPNALYAYISNIYDLHCLGFMA